MDKETRVIFVEAIRKYCTPSQRYYRANAYTLKKCVFERLTGDYIAEADFVDLMLAEGYRQNKKGAFNVFVAEVSEISPYYRGCGMQPWKYKDYR